MDGVPVHEPDRGAVAGDVEGDGGAVDAAGVGVLVLLRIALEGEVGAVSPDLVQFCAGEGEFGRGDRVMGADDRADDAGDLGIKGHRPESHGDQVDHGVPGASTRTDVGVGGLQDDIVDPVSVPVGLLQAADDLEEDGLEHQRCIDGDHADPVAGGSVGVDDGPGEQPLPDARGGLLGDRVAVHAGTQGLTGGVRDAETDVDPRT